VSAETPLRLLALRGGAGVVELPAEGALRLGTGTVNDLVLRAPGVGFRHALVRAAPGGAEVEDLGARGGTWIDDSQVPPRGRAPLRPGGRLRLGGAAEVVLLAPAPPPSPALRQAWPLGLRALLEDGGRPLAEALEAARPAARPELERAGVELLHELGRLVRPGLLPPGPGEGLLVDPSGALRFAGQSPRARMRFARWALLVELAVPLPGAPGAARAAEALAQVLRDPPATSPGEWAALADGTWTWSREAPPPLPGDAEWLAAWSDGARVAVALRPRWAVRPLRPEVAVEPREELLRAREALHLWRPVHGEGQLTAPALPPGGRARRRGRRPRPR
jgi:hypothetical protein